jgi:DNA (cytosine-5)-methyltransferase 1
VGENVRGLTNWNGGMVFDEVQADLEAQGYEVLPFLLPACAVNAPHRRDRIWFVAKDTNQNGWRGEQWKKESSIGKFGDIGARNNEWIQADNDKIGNASNTSSNGYDDKSTQRNNKLGENSQQSRAQRKRTSEGFSNERDATDTNGTNSEAWTQRKVLGQSDRQKANGYSNVECRNQWENFPTVSPICIGDDGLSDRLDSITFPKWRNESIKAGGNAIVPQVAYQIFKALSL